MTNEQILLEATEAIGFEWDGDNLFTYAEWKARGKQVKRGAKALITTSLWRPFTVEEEKDGEKKVKRFKMVKCYLFSDEQVEDAKEDKRNASRVV